MSREDKGTELRRIVDELADYERQRHQLHMEVEKLREQSRLISARIQVDVAIAKDDKGKPLYSNQNVRDAAVTVKLAEDEALQTLKPEIDRLNNEIRSIQIEQNRLSMHKQILMLELGLQPPPSPF
jgi:hypothetical protein